MKHLKLLFVFSILIIGCKSNQNVVSNEKASSDFVENESNVHVIPVNKDFFIAENIIGEITDL